MVTIPLCLIKFFFPLSLPRNGITNSSYIHAGQATLMKSVLKPGYNFDKLLVLGTFKYIQPALIVHFSKHPVLDLKIIVIDYAHVHTLSFVFAHIS